MKQTRIVAAFSLSMALMIAGCQRQSQLTPSSPYGAAQSAAPNLPSNMSTSVQKATPVIVLSTTVSTAKEAPTTTATQTKVSEVSFREDLPQADERVVLQGVARTTLEAALAVASGSEPVLLPEDTTAPLMDSLPEGFRNSCTAIMAGWGGTAKWTVRVLFSLHRVEGTEAVLTFRCASSAKGNENYYDERPAIVSLTPETATLTLVPLAKAEDGDPTLYQLSFSQAFRAIGAQLVEVNAYHSTDNPCCDGGDEESGNRLMSFDLSTGKQVLTLDQSTERDNHDDAVEDGDTQTICRAKISYLRDRVGNVGSIETETQCTENEKPLPEVKRQSYRWNVDAHSFDELK